MGLADFIDANTPAILAQWDTFASSLTPTAAEMDSAALRDHAGEILLAIAEDLRTPQNRSQHLAKSIGKAPVLPGSAETQTHAILRVAGGLSVRHVDVDAGVEERINAPLNASSSPAPAADSSRCQVQPV